jgi:sugar lactone lactonase YvrE
MADKLCHAGRSHEGVDALITVLDGLAFPEGARWHDGALYFSDMHDGIVWRLAPDGAATKILEIRTLPSGLGWLPDGSMCVVSMEDRRLLRLTPESDVSVVADLSTISPYVLNDMVIDQVGRAYIGTFGCDFNGGDPPRPTQVFCVQPDGSVSVAADGIMFPNGAAITADGRTFIVAETFGECLSAYDIDADGALSNRRVFGGYSGFVPDGLCLDAEGGVWVACLGANRIIRMIDGGTITDTIALPGRDSYACALGGSDRRDLYICTARSYVPSETRALRSGRIEVERVAIPGAGLL